MAGNESSVAMMMSVRPSPDAFSPRFAISRFCKLTQSSSADANYDLTQAPLDSRQGDARFFSIPGLLLHRFTAQFTFANFHGWRSRQDRDKLDVTGNHKPGHPRYEPFDQLLFAQ